MSFKLTVLFVFLLIATEAEANEKFRAKVYSGKEVTTSTSSSLGVSLIQCQTMCVLARRKCTSMICGYDIVSKTCSYSLDSEDDLITTNGITKVVLIPVDDACQTSEYLVNGAEPVSDAQITASTSYSLICDTRGARLNTIATDAHQGAWAAKIHDKNQYIQVQFNCLNHVLGVALQGKPPLNQYVTAYKVLFSYDCVNFRTIMDTNGYDKVSVIKKHTLNCSVFSAKECKPFVIAFDSSSVVM
ncbi:HMCT-like protein [Mya arenaria]|uniref:HMCT-like protein n=1 Tax=Mya arenaria TaxID=6604 RepID=A0ABY7ES55_MYAAR|nr:HMCT-like protein [Mya arenaria]